MKRLAGLLVALSLLMLIAPISAQETKEDAKKAKAQAKQAEGKKPAAERKRKRQPTLAERTLKQLSALNLTEEQKKQIQTLAAEYAPKLQAARKKVNELIPEQQRKARQEAIAKARAEGKKPSEVVTAFKPTAEQQAAQKAVQDVNKEFNAKVNQLLTREQKQARRQARQEARQKNADGEKKPDKKAEAKNK